jgi:hypothetical protein
LRRPDARLLTKSGEASNFASTRLAQASVNERCGSAFGPP